MITDKLFVKILALVIAAVSALSFVSCKKNTSIVQSGTLEDILQQIADDNKDIEEVEVFAELYRIVLPEAASPDLYSGARKLADKISSATDTYAEVIYDYQEPVFVEGAFEIILGRTSRYQSRQILRDLRADDYICKMYVDSLVLGGISDTATLTAIDRFCREILPEATNVVLMRKEQEFLYNGKYEIERVEIGGFALSEYDIIYSADGELDELYFANLLKNVILERSGYFLDVVSEEEYLGGRYISIGADVGDRFGADIPENQACIIQRGSNFLISADSVRGFDEIIAEFVDMLLPANDKGVISHWFADGVLLSKEYFSRTITFSAIADAGSASLSIPKINAVTSFIRDAESDLVLSAGADPELMSRVLFGLSDIKAASKNIDGKILSLLYSEDQPVDVSVEDLQGCVIICGKVSFLDGHSLLVFDGYCGSGGIPEWIARRIEDIADREGLPFVAMITEGVRTAEEVDIDGAWCIDKELGLYASDNISAEVVREQSAYGVTVKDIAVTINF